MRYILSIFSLFLFSLQLSAQQETTALVSDSVFFYRQASANTAFLLENAAAITLSNTNRAAYASLIGNYRSGHLRGPQEAEYQGSAAFNTAGLQTLGRFKVSGYFTYAKTWQDSLAMAAKDLDDGTTIYYQGAGKAGKYQRQKYELGGILTYRLSRENVFLSAGIDYLFNNMTRSVDPRPAVNTFSIRINPGITYKRKNQAFGIYYRGGYGDEYVRNTYRQAAFSDQGITDPIYPDRLNIFMEGYGLIDLNYKSNSKSSMDRVLAFSGIQGSHVFAGKKWEIKQNLSYTVDYQRTRTLTSAADPDTYTLGEYQLEALTYSGLFNINTAGANQQFVLTAASKNGDDFNHGIGWSNYLYKERSIGLSYLRLATTQKNFRPEYGIGLSYTKSQKHDYVTEHHFYYSKLDVALMATAYLQNHNGNKLSLSLSPALSKSLESKLNNVPSTQINYFTQQVVWSEQYYNAIDIGSVTLGLNYISKNMISLFPVRISASGQYLIALNTPHTDYPLSHYAAKNRLLAQIAFGILL